MINLNFLMNHVLYQILISDIKVRYYFELLIPRTMKLIGSTKNKVTEDKNGENVPHLEITEVLVFP